MGAETTAYEMHALLAVHAACVAPCAWYQDDMLCKCKRLSVWSDGKAASLRL